MDPRFSSDRVSAPLRRSSPDRRPVLNRLSSLVIGVAPSDFRIPAVVKQAVNLAEASLSPPASSVPTRGMRLALAVEFLKLAAAPEASESLATLTGKGLIKVVEVDDMRRTH
jgi:hypothetical protein